MFQQKNKKKGKLRLLVCPLRTPTKKREVKCSLAELNIGRSELDTCYMITSVLNTDAGGLSGSSLHPRLRLWCAKQKVRGSWWTHWSLEVGIK